MSHADVVIETERLTDELVAEILPLGQKCWNESTVQKGEACAFYGERDFAIEPNVDAYKNLQNSGALVLIVMRHDKVAVGYVLGWSYRALHHKHVTGGIGDTFYVEPEFRAYAGLMVDKFVAELETRKVQIIGWPVILEGYIYKLLAARGFVGDDIVMEKRLCA